MRANLFASATATNFGGLRSSRAATHGDGRVRPFRIWRSNAVRAAKTLGFYAALSKGGVG